MTITSTRTPPKYFGDQVVSGSTALMSSRRCNFSHKFKKCPMIQYYDIMKVWSISFALLQVTYRSRSLQWIRSCDTELYMRLYAKCSHCCYTLTYHRRVLCVNTSGGPLSALTRCVNARLLSAIKKISPLIYSQSWVGSWVYTTQAMMTFTLIF